MKHGHTTAEQGHATTLQIDQVKTKRQSMMVHRRVTCQYTEVALFP